MVKEVSGTQFLATFFENIYFTRPAKREQSKCAEKCPKILTGALVRDTGTLRVSNNFFGVI